MDDVKKMLRAIINGQSSLKDDLTKQVVKSREESEKRSEHLEVRIDELEKNLTNRINRIGLQLAYLDDDGVYGSDEEWGTVIEEYFL